MKYPPKYSVSYIAKRIKERRSGELPEGISTPHGNGASIGLRAPACFHGSVGHGLEVVERYIPNQEKPNAKSLCTDSVLNCGVW